MTELIGRMQVSNNDCKDALHRTTSIAPHRSRLTVQSPLAVCRWITQWWSSKLGTPTKELTRGWLDPWNNIYDRLFDPSCPSRRVCSLINFQPQALSTDMSLLRPVDHSDNCSCSNRQRTTAQAKIVVTKKGKKRFDQRDLGSMHMLGWF